jgi:hypothetical protein
MNTEPNSVIECVAKTMFFKGSKVNSTFFLFRWTFRTEKADIGFAVYNEKKEEVNTYHKYEADVQKQEGFLLCGKIGKCSYSYGIKEIPYLILIPKL